MGKWGPFDMGYNSTYNWLGSHLATIPQKIKDLGARGIVLVEDIFRQPLVW